MKKVFVKLKSIFLEVIQNWNEIGWGKKDLNVWCVVSRDKARVVPQYMSHFSTNNKWVIICFEYLSCENR
jgi:hypothetical protein